MRSPLLLTLGALVALALAALFWPWSAFAPPADPGSGGQAGVQVDGPASPSAGSRVPVVAGGEGRTVDPHVGVVRVLVRGDAAEPLGDCTVRVGDAEASSGEDGAAEVEVAPGRLWLDVTSPDPQRTPLRQRVTAVGGRVVEVVAVLPQQLLPDLWCRVVAADDRAPIDGAHLLPQPSADAEVVTGADGVALVKGGGEGEFVRVTAPGRAVRRVVPSAGHGTADTALEVPLERGADVHIAVVDDKGAPVGEVDIAITAMAWAVTWPAAAPARGGPELWSLRLGADGTGSLRDLPPHARLIVAVTPPIDVAGPSTEAWELQPGANEKVIRLQPLGEIRGRVLDASDRAVAGARVVAMPAATGVAVLPDSVDGVSMITGADGAFQLPGITAGVWLVGLHATEGLASECRRVEVAPGQAAQADLHAVAALSISGRLLGPGNQPISAFEVHALRDGVVVATAITERDGSYRLESLLPGDYDVATELYENSLAMVEPVHVPAGRSNVDIRVASVLGTVRGHFEPADTGGGDYWLHGWRRGGDENCGGRCDLDRRFEQPSLRAGTWDFTVTDARGNVGVLHGVAVESGRSTPDLEIAMHPGAIVRPAHADADAFCVARGDDVAVRGPIERGLPGEAVVPPGTWSVLFLRRGFEIARTEVTVAAGEQRLVAVP